MVWFSLNFLPVSTDYHSVEISLALFVSSSHFLPVSTNYQRTQILLTCLVLTLLISCLYSQTLNIMVTVYTINTTCPFPHHSLPASTDSHSEEIQLKYLVSSSLFPLSRNSCSKQIQLTWFDPSLHSLPASRNLHTNKIPLVFREPRLHGQFSD